eukprot:3271663-Rhodomonas_salina.3
MQLASSFCTVDLFSEWQSVFALVPFCRPVFSHHDRTGVSLNTRGILRDFGKIRPRSSWHPVHLNTLPIAFKRASSQNNLLRLRAQFCDVGAEQK